MMDLYQSAREKMVAEQIERRGIHSPRLLDVLRRIPRHHFVPPEQINRAYDDCPLPIGNGQTISQPYIVALMTSLLNLQGNEAVLEIGTGSGYQAAVLSGLAHTVHSVERYPDLAKNAHKLLAELNINNVHIHVGDGSSGWPENAPYQGILVTAAAPSPPEPLFQQMAEGARMVIPVGPRHTQELQVWERTGSQYSRQDIIPVAFVPLRGVHGWQENDWQDG